MSRSRVLLIIPDAMLRQTVAGHLEGAAGLTVTQAADLDAAAELAAGHHLAVVDEAATKGGVCPCHALRARGVSLPLLLLGGSGTDGGAEEVMAKPLRLAALASRIRDLLARPPEAAGPMAIGPWRLDIGRLSLLREDGRTARLTHKEAAILRRLALAGGGIVSRAVLLSEVWGYSEAVDTHTLETHIYRLRRKIDPGSKAGLLISEAGGYRLGGGAS